MISFIQLFYLLFVFITAILSIFVVYHINRYSIDRDFAKIQIYFFIGGTLVLLGINITLFLFLPLEEIGGNIPSGTFLPSSY